MNLLGLSELQAIELLEPLRWPDGVACHHCKSHEATKLNGKKLGLWKCRKCGKQFSLKMGTIMQRSRVPLRTWVSAFYLMSASKKGISALQLKRMLGISYQTAWSMCHKIRSAMANVSDGLLSGLVEMDETYVGGKPRPVNNYRRPAKAKPKVPVIAMVERGGRVKAFQAKKVSAYRVKKLLKDNVDTSSIIMTDEAPVYKRTTAPYKAHKSVNHSMKQYANGDIYTNTVESFFAIIKRSVMGVYHHISKKYMQSYCNEYVFRWNTRKISDRERTLIALSQACLS